MYRKALLIALAALTLGGGLPVHAQPPPGPPQAGGDPLLGLHRSVYAAADALGMIRGVGRTHTATGLIITSYEGTGTMNGQPLKYRYEYVYAPYRAARLLRTSQDGKTTIEAVRDGRAWNETAPGINPTDVKSGAELRMAEIFLTPHGAMRAVIEADAKAVSVTGPAGSTVITAPTNIGTVRMVLGEGNRPARAEVRIGGRTLAAEFSGYKDFNNYGVFVPAKIVRLDNGKVVGELSVTSFAENPFVIVPLPEKLIEAAKSQ